jgi:predicted permease
MISAIFTIVAPVLAVALVGYLWDRQGLPFDTEMVTLLVSRVGTPCLLIHSFLTIRPDLALTGRIVAAGFLLVLVMGVAAWIILRILNEPARVFLPAIMFPNTGNMGLPLCLFAFGDTGLALAVVFFAAVTMVQFSLGIAIASGQFAARDFLRNPALIAIVIAGGASATGLALPQWLSNTVDVLGQMTIPLMLLSLGTALARLQVTDLKRSLGFSLVRLGGGFVVALGITAVLGIADAARGAVLVQSAMPSAVFNYLFAARYGNRPEEVAGVVFLSTILSFLTLPLLMAFVLKG